MDQRAQSIGISRYFLGVIVGAVVVWLLNYIANPILTTSASSTSAGYANDGTQWIQQAINYFPIFVLLVSFFGLIVYAVFVREVRR